MAQQMPALHHAIFHVRRGYEPVADNNGEDGKRPQKIDIAIALGRCLLGHGASAGPEGGFGSQK